jgi:CRP/FNR family cyclic AMP-dependent transcriptional regulator
LRSRAIRTWETIIQENSRSDELYVIAEGEVEILLDPTLVSAEPVFDRQLERIAKMRRGQSFGEIALVDRGLRSAAARAAENDTRLLVIPREKLLALCEADLRIGFILMRNLAADLALKIRTTDIQFRQSLL